MNRFHKNKATKKVQETGPKPVLFPILLKSTLLYCLFHHYLVGKRISIDKKIQPGGGLNIVSLVNLRGACYTFHCYKVGLHQILNCSSWPLWTRPRERVINVWTKKHKNKTRQDNLNFNEQRISKANDEKEIWNIVNEVVNPRKDSEWKLKNDKGETITDEQEIANTFNNFFIKKIDDLKEGINKEYVEYIKV